MSRNQQSIMYAIVMMAQVPSYMYVYMYICVVCVYPLSHLLIPLPQSPHHPNTRHRRTTQSSARAPLLFAPPQSPPAHHPRHSFSPRNRPARSGTVCGIGTAYDTAHIPTQPSHVPAPLLPSLLLPLLSPFPPPLFPPTPVSPPPPTKTTGTPPLSCTTPGAPNLGTRSLDALALLCPPQTIFLE